MNIVKEFQEIMEKVNTETFFAGKGLGNEIAFYIYDYDPKFELEVRDSISEFHKKIEKVACKRVKHIDMLDFVVSYLKNNELLEAAYNLQKESGNANLLEALKGVVNEEKLTEIIGKEVLDEKSDLLLISGIGKAYPISRAHNLLNNLHSKIGSIPLIMFYPGKYDKQSLRLFNEFKDDNYYRAFKLIDRQGY